MKTVIRTKSRKGFTLVEILIVVIILGILAAIVIPQFTNASTDARKNSLSSQLQTMRSQFELYKLQHNDKLPLVFQSTGTKTDVGGCWAGMVGSATVSASRSSSVMCTGASEKGDGGAGFPSLIAARRSTAGT